MTTCHSTHAHRSKQRQVVGSPPVNTTARCYESVTDNVTAQTSLAHNHIGGGGRVHVSLSMFV